MVDRELCCDCGDPCLWFVDLVFVVCVVQQCFLYDVFGVGDVVEYLVGDGECVLVQRFELVYAGFVMSCLWCDSRLCVRISSGVVSIVTYS